VLRINWHSPLPAARTDIAHFTARIAPALSQVANVVFWTSQKDIDPVFAERYRINRINSDALREPGLYQQLLQGINIYNIGNNADFHRHIFRTALQIPGVVIAHDSAIHHFMFEMSREDTPPWSRYLAWSKHVYGQTGYEKAKSAVDSMGQTLDGIVNEMPFIEAALTNALGVVCHSQQAVHDIQNAHTSVAPVLLPLPFAPTVDLPAKKEDASDIRRLIIFGYIGSNRRLEYILRAVASFEHRDQFQLDIFGTLWDHERITGLIQTLGLKNTTIHGFTAESLLEKALHSADLAFNLRWPTVGEASGGILRSWNAKLPALVTDAGWYADLPDDIVVKTTVKTEEADIHAALKRVLEEPDIMQAIGARAYAHLNKYHTPQIYAESLVAALSAIPQFSAELCARLTLENVLSTLTPTSAERDAYADCTIGYLSDMYGP